MFEELDFVYLPCRDVAAELALYVDGLGADLIYAIEAFGTPVAMLSLAPSAPNLLLAEHLHGEVPVLIFRVPNLVEAVADLEARGVEHSTEFGFPDGDAVEVELPGPQRIAIYERTRPDRATEMAGRRDF